MQLDQGRQILRWLHQAAVTTSLGMYSEAKILLSQCEEAQKIELASAKATKPSAGQPTTDANQS